MGFHIDASDRAHAEQASTFDFSHQNSVSGFFYVAFSAKTSVAYVSSQQSDSDSAINVKADLTGEVDLTFETDYLPLNRLARAESIEQIRANTPNPAANTPNAAASTTARPAPAPGSTSTAKVSTGIATHRAAPAPTINPADAANAANRTGLGGATPGGAGGAPNPAPPAVTPAPRAPGTPGAAPAPGATGAPAGTGTPPPAVPAPAPAVTPPPRTPALAPTGSGGGGGGINLGDAAGAVTSIVGLVASGGAG